MKNPDPVAGKEKRLLNVPDKVGERRPTVADKKGVQREEKSRPYPVLFVCK